MSGTICLWLTEFVGLCELHALDPGCRAEEDALAPRLGALDRLPTAERASIADNVARARAHCAAGDHERGIATYRHVAAFLAAGGFGDAAREP